MEKIRRFPLVPFNSGIPAVVLPLLLLGAGQETLAAEDASPVEVVIDGLTLRSIGPAMMGGRIADIEVDPESPSTWYIAVGSGGVWKTGNAGITWNPVFDDQKSYSIGEVTLDPQNPSTVWVGTGENVSGRHVGWGDGVYRSLDGGTTWTPMGLEKSEHIGRILVDPKNSDHILVAAEGPLWSSGGERGVYRSTDGGESWSAVLSVDDKTGATDLEFHPEDPSVIYAATYERRRTVWSFLAGGPGSGFWKSTDGGATWREITNGLPSENDTLEIGKIGLAVTPAAPDRVYATIEANDGEQGFFVSHDRGESWERRNEYISGGTGPHYYQEIEASPVDADRVYQMDVFLHTTSDGGNSFNVLGTGRAKHSDNHALWIDPAAPMHLLAGTDGGLYESFDDGATWRHFPNLPISQFYKVAVSDHSPYYNVLVGAQDLGTLHGPSRTTNVEGIRNQDWYVPYGADGYGVAFDLFDDDVFYQMSQKGNLIRHHAPSKENISIRPQPAADESPERWNWDSPLEVSPHKAGRIFFGSQRVWQSDDRGNSWTAISGDLTSGKNRFTLPVDGRVRSTDALWDLNAMSGYATLTAISQSPLQGEVLWTGSDDGLVHSTTDGGDNWKDATPSALPDGAFINDVEASQHADNGAFVVADNHKTGDYRPLLFATNNGGKSWRDISGDLPGDIIVWAIQQDHIEPGLLFLAAENGLYVTLDGGERWRILSAGVPTVPFRDLKLQRRDNDLVGASFGRGVYILDDYRPLRTLAANLRTEGNAAPGHGLFPVRDAWWYLASKPGQAAGIPSQGSTAYKTANPELGPLFSVYLSEPAQTPKEQRRKKEKEWAAAGKDIPFPGWNALSDEASAGETRYYVEVSDADGSPVRRIRLENTAGLQRVSWDMRGDAPDPISFPDGSFRAPWMSDPQGPLLAPAGYSAQLLKVGPGDVERLGSAQSFELTAVTTLPEGTDYLATVEFQQELSGAQRQLHAVDEALKEITGETRYLRAAVDASPQADPALHQSIDALESEIAELKTMLRGNSALRRLSEAVTHSAARRISSAARAMNTRMPPTATQREDLRVGKQWMIEITDRAAALRENQLASIKAALLKSGAPYVPGQALVK
ncbi:VPS10 domain-containing protein [Congregibacter sp.]|uniref:WD40/YVTN/BNR-like repeat-containing protein n=1 Tax=Congregibacter sp. TaxID=2744308 RepID=UPI003F6B9926